MSEQENLVESNLEDSDLDIENLEGQDENDTSWEDSKKNPSNQHNWKKLYKKAKTLEREKKELEEKLKELEANKEDKKVLETADTDTKLELRIFWIENPEAKAHLSKILETATNHNMDLETAWNFLKATMPKESQSYDDFSTKGKKNISNIDYKSISIDDSLKLNAEERKLWRKANWLG